MSSCCCSKTYLMCTVMACDGQSLVLPVPVPADGAYALELEFLTSVIRRSAMLTQGDSATFEDVPLNENYTYTGRVLDDTGDPVTFTIDEIDYDCFQFTTKRLAA